MATGKFIVIDGTDGTGKETQVNLLREALESGGYSVAVADFPRYGEKSAGMVEEYLNGKFGTAEEVGPYAASIFYAMDRYAASAEIRKFLEEGRIVLSNRYTSANMGHQAGKIADAEERDAFLDWLDDLEFNILKIPRPDMNILLYSTPEMNQRLVDAKSDKTRKYIESGKRDIHEDNREHLKNARDAFLYAAEKYNWLAIDCLTKNGNMRSREDISGEIWNMVKKIV